jgi:YidC/Oxa1 family membrane protein insertase
LLTTIVKAVTLPLTQTSMKSMKAMQKLQPEMQRLRERYKDDQTTLQKEVMELYKRHRVPGGGLPAAAARASDLRRAL